MRNAAPFIRKSLGRRFLGRRFLGAACLAVAAGCADPDIRRGDEALAYGRYLEAIDFYAAARTRLPDDPQPARGIASAHRAQAAERLAEGRCDDARAHLAEAEELTPPLLVDHQELARCLNAGGAPVEARIAQYHRLLSLGDARASLLRMLVALELEAGRDADAVAHFAMLEQRDFLSLDERRKLVDALLRLDRLPEAAPHIEKVVAADPHDALLRLKLAELHEANGAPAVARQAYEALVADFPRNPVVHLRLADFLRRQGDASAAGTAQAEADRLRGVAPPPERHLRPLKRSRR